MLCCVANSNCNFLVFLFKNYRGDLMKTKIKEIMQMTLFVLLLGCGASVADWVLL